MIRNVLLSTIFCWCVRVLLWLLCWYVYVQVVFASELINRAAYWKDNYNDKITIDNEHNATRHGTSRHITVSLCVICAR